MSDERRNGMPAHVVGTSRSDCRERGKRGWSEADAWSLDTYLAGIIAGGARQLAERNCGYPTRLADKHHGDEDAAVAEWQSILTRIADGFGEYVEGKFTDNDADEKLAPAFDLLREFWSDLWD